MEQEKLYTVKEVGERYGITRKTLFYYDKAGLVSPKSRLGIQLYKLYSKEELERLEKVIKYRSCGLTISEIKYLMNQEQKDLEDCIKMLTKAMKRLCDEKNAKDNEIHNLEELIREVMMDCCI